jgi:hypothetical protein
VTEYRHSVGRDAIAPTISEISALGLEVVVTCYSSIAFPLTQALPQIAVVFLVQPLTRSQAGWFQPMATPADALRGQSTVPIGQTLETFEGGLPTVARAAFMLPTDGIDALAFQRLATAAQ